MYKYIKYDIFKYYFINLLIKKIFGRYDKILIDNIFLCFHEYTYKFIFILSA